MYYQTMQSQAREKHQQLRREAQIHRVARQNHAAKNETGRPAPVARVASAFAAFVTALAAAIK